jgi:hypothetical protein
MLLVNATAGNAKIYSAESIPKLRKGHGILHSFFSLHDILPTGFINIFRVHPVLFTVHCPDQEPNRDVTALP